jgi:hypothetical protein
MKELVALLYFVTCGFWWCALVNGRSTGPGICSYEGILDNMGAGMELVTKLTSFNATLNTTFAMDGDVVEVTLHGPSAFKGVFLVFEDESGVNGGEWQFRAGFTRPTKCESKNIALGHANPIEKDVPMTFQWVVPSSKVMKSASFTLRGVVVVDFETYGAIQPTALNVSQVTFTRLFLSVWLTIIFVDGAFNLVCQGRW